MKPILQRYPLLPIFIAVFLDFFSIGLTITVLPELFKDEEAGLFAVELIRSKQTDFYYLILSGLFFVGTFLGSPVLGAFSDRLGRKRILMLTAFFSAFSTMVAGLGIYFSLVALLFLSRLVSGLLGSMLIIINSSLADVSKPEDKAKNFGITGVAFGIAISTGTIGGAVLTTLQGGGMYHLPFLVSFCVAALNFLFIWLYYPETYPAGVQRAVSWFSGPANIRKAFTSPTLRGTFMIVFAVSLGFTMYFQSFQISMINIFGLGPVEFAAMLIWAGLWISIAQGILLRLASRWLSPKQILQFAIPAFALSFVLLGIQDNVWGYAAFVPLFTIAQGFIFPNALAIISNNVSEEMQGEIIGINQSVVNLAGSCPIVLGYFMKDYEMFPLYFGCICCIVAWFILQFLLRSIKRQESIA